MIQFRWPKVSNRDGTPILKDSEIDELTEMLICDYNPKLLKEPGRVDWCHFLEYYLGATLDVQDIYYEEGERPILGATAFNTEVLRVFDRENLCTRKIKVKRRTVILDRSITLQGKESLALSTGLHEAGHLWLHSGVYSQMDGQMSFMKDSSSVVCCRIGGIELSGTKKRLETPLEWREHQAGYFAAAFAMPKKTLVPFAKDLIKRTGYFDDDQDSVVLGKNCILDWVGRRVLPGQIAEQYGVSRQAAIIRLQKCGILVTEETAMNRWSI
jgi:hypothetical protein